MRLLKFFISFLWFITTSVAFAQSDENLRIWISDIIESMVEDADEDQDFSFLIDELLLAYNSPININTAQREDLERIVFLSDANIEALLFQRYQVGQFSSIFELQAVEGFNRQLIMWLEPFIIFDDADIEKITYFTPRGDVFMRTQFALQTPRGYQQQADSTVSFQGDKFKHYVRSELEPLQRLKIGFVAEKDAGEPWFNNQVKTFDYVSGYIHWKPQRFVKDVIIGQYRFSSAQGLGLQTGMAPRKSAMVTSLRNRNSAYRPSLAVSESSGLNGLLLAFGNNNFTITPFVSLKNIDGRLDVDSAGQIFITNLKTDGYHRTITELEQRKNVLQQVYGLQVKGYIGRFIFEAGHLDYRIQYPLKRNIQPYNMHYFSGNSNANSWLGFEGSVYNIHLFSEVAFNNSLHPAVWAGSLYNIKGHVNMSVAYRRIPLSYVAPLGAPLSEAGQFAGERGFYSGIEFGLPGKITIASYIDYFEHKWLRFQLKAPSSGYDFLAVVTHRPNRQWENVFRYRHRHKLVSLKMDTPDYNVGDKLTDQLRFQTRFSPNDLWSFTSRVDFQYVKVGDDNSPYGFMLSQDVRLRPANGRLNFVMRYALFDAQHYDTRIYAYEPDLLYSFSTPAYYGQGSRFVFLTKFNVVAKLDVWVRYAQWHYSNRTTIGSGNMTIDGNVSSEIRMQIRYRF
jgi:hypothetical protein